jgi:hypothetical protein
VLYVAMNLLAILVPRQQRPSPVIWGRSLDASGAQPGQDVRLYYLLTPALLARIRAQMANLDERYQAGEIPGEKLQIILQRWDAIREWAAEHFSEEACRQAEPTGELPEPSVDRQTILAGLMLGFGEGGEPCKRQRR